MFILSWSEKILLHILLSLTFARRWSSRRNQPNSSITSTSHRNDRFSREIWLERTDFTLHCRLIPLFHRVESPPARLCHPVRTRPGKRAWPARAQLELCPGEGPGHVASRRRKYKAGYPRYWRRRKSRNVHVAVHYRAAHSLRPNARNASRADIVHAVCVRVRMNRKGVAARHRRDATRRDAVIAHAARLIRRREQCSRGNRLSVFHAPLPPSIEKPTAEETPIRNASRPVLCVNRGTNRARFTIDTFDETFRGNELAKCSPKGYAILARFSSDLSKLDLSSFHLSSCNWLYVRKNTWIFVICL